MTYTQSKNKEVEKYIQKKVDIIIEVILSKIPDTVSIIMAGGFGRGEGGVHLNKDEIFPINDFDMIVVTKKLYDEDFVNNVGEIATTKIGKKTHPSLKIFDKYKFKPFTEFFYVDLKAIPVSKLKKLMPMVKYYELKHSSNVVYGDKSVLDKIPNIKIEDIPLGEGVRLLMNRMSHLIQYFYPNFLKRKHIPAEHEMLFVHVIKTYLAGAVSLSLLTGDYKPTYGECVNNLQKNFDKKFEELSKHIPEYPQEVKKFLNLKYFTNLSLYKRKDLDLWENSKKYIGLISKYYLSKFLKKEINNWDEFSKLLMNCGYDYYSPYMKFIIKEKFGIEIKSKFILKILSTLAQLYLNMVYFIRIRKNYNKTYLRALFKFQPPELTFFSALPHILYSLGTDGKVNLKMLEKGKKILARTYPVDAKRKDFGSDLEYWESISDSYSQAYMLFAFLRIA